MLRGLYGVLLGSICYVTFRYPLVVTIIIIESEKNFHITIDTFLLNKRQIINNYFITTYIYIHHFIIHGFDGASKNHILKK